MKSEEIISSQYVKVPNWYFDEIQPLAPNGFSCLLLTILRETIGWRVSEFRFTFSELTRKSGVTRDAVSRWLYAMQLVGWIFYIPAKNGSAESLIKLRDLPTREKARVVAAAISGVAAKWNPAYCGTAKFIQALSEHLAKEHGWQFVTAPKGQRVDTFIESQFRQSWNTTGK